MNQQTTDIPTDKLIAIRRHLHQYPELSGKEVETARYIAHKLQSDYAPDQIIEGLGGTGLAAIYDSRSSGPTVLFRCELDALPIQEVNDFDYQSEWSGISHKCGHDGHMTVLIGLAAWLQSHPPTRGRVVLLFQPAEETGAGAVQVLTDPTFDYIRPDFAYAFHNLPGYPLGQVIVKAGPFTSAVNSIILKLTGKTSHAGEPYNGKNPAMAMASILEYTQMLNQPDRSRSDFSIFTPVYAHLGEKAYGVSAGYGELHFTVRTRNEDEMTKRQNQLLDRVNGIAHGEGLKLDVDYTDRFFGNHNDQHAVDRIIEVAQKLGYAVNLLDAPLSFGEDFGAFSQKIKGAMFCIGAGEKTPALHNPDYDFPEEIIPQGIRLFSGLLAYHTHV